MPPTAVIALGGNDSESLLAFMFWVEGTIDTLPANEPIIWVNFYSQNPNYFNGNKTAYDIEKNKVLNFVAGRHSNVTVLDWASVIAQHPEDMQPDGVHYTPAGYLLRAETIAQAVSP